MTAATLLRGMNEWKAEAAARETKEEERRAEKSDKKSNRKAKRAKVVERASSTATPVPKCEAEKKRAANEPPAAGGSENDANSGTLLQISNLDPRKTRMPQKFRLLRLHPLVELRMTI